MPESKSRKWFALAILCIAQFMVVLDVSVVNVALPSIQRGLHFSQQNLLWVLNAYTLLFGGFLMLGGRVADNLGRRRMFVSGVVLFSVASLFCGLATSSGWLITARAIQGLGAAILSPAALSILTVTFAEGRERNQALSIWGAIGGFGGAVGVLLGGVLTQEVGWSWIFNINVPIGASVVAVSFIVLDRLPGTRGESFDLPGAISVTTGLSLLVFALVKSNDWGWTSEKTLLCLLGSVLLLSAFAWIESKQMNPLVPLSIFHNRSLSASNAVALILGASIFAMFYLLSLYMQQVLGYSPLRTGVAYLCIAGPIIVAAGLAQVLVARVGVRTVLSTGMVLSAGGLAYFSQISVHASFVTTLLPGFLLAGVGLGLSFVPVTIGAMSGVVGAESGVASGLITTTQQVGGALGVAVLSTIALSATRSFKDARFHMAAAVTHGFSIAFWFAALISIVGAVVAACGLKGVNAVVREVTPFELPR